MNHTLPTLCLLFAITLCKESDTKTKDKQKSDSDESSQGEYTVLDEINIVENQCCSKNNADCCVSLIWRSSISKEEHVPPEFGRRYFCENFDVTKSKGCDDLDYILLPVSKSCDFTRVLWSVRVDSPDIDSPANDCDGFSRAQVLVDGEIILNNADEFIVSPGDDNPTGYHALKVPIATDDEDTHSVSICTQLQWGDIIEEIDGEDIEIGYSMNDDMFSCSNSSIRDICSINASLAITVDKAENARLNVLNLHGDDAVFDNYFNIFEYYWNEYVGFGIAVFASSIFFNIVMCIYWSQYRKSCSDEYNDEMAKIMIDEDDETETESDDTDDLEREEC